MRPTDSEAGLAEGDMALRAGLMHWLGSPEAGMRRKAKAELASRGYDESQIAVATQIASGDVMTRLALVDAIARSTEIDPRPWLYMMLEDTSREVKQRALSVLATMKDPQVDQRLQTQLARESDTTFAAQIRRVLQLR